MAQDPGSSTGKGKATTGKTPKTNGAAAEPFDLDSVPVNDIDLLKIGYVRFTIEDEVYVLRRPTFGELKDIRARLAEVEDRLNQMVGKTAEYVVTSTAQITEARQAGDQETIERLNDEITNNRNKMGRELVDVADTARIEWIEHVFTVLGVSDPQMPAEWPAWIIDISLPPDLIGHWRSSPLARGR